MMIIHQDPQVSGEELEVKDLLTANRRHYNG